MWKNQLTYRFGSTPATHQFISTCVYIPDHLLLASNHCDKDFDCQLEQLQLFPTVTTLVFSSVFARVAFLGAGLCLLCSESSPFFSVPRVLDMPRHTHHTTTGLSTYHLLTCFSHHHPSSCQPSSSAPRQHFHLPSASTPPEQYYYFLYNKLYSSLQAESKKQSLNITDCTMKIAGQREVVQSRETGILVF